MSKVPSEMPQKSRWRNGATYTCVDDIQIRCNCDTFEMDEGSAPRNGVLLQPDGSPTISVNGTQTNRNMRKITRGGPSKTYAFPSTTTTVGKDAFYGNKVISVRFNDGLRALENGCFESSGIRKLVLPTSIESIDGYAFDKCEHLEYVDLRAAHGLKSIGKLAFSSCGALK